MPHKGLIRKVMSLSLFQLKRPQEDLEIANSVMKWFLLTWSTQAAMRCCKRIFAFHKKYYATRAVINVIRKNLDTITKNN